MKTNKKIFLWIISLSINIYSYSQNLYTIIENKGQYPKGIISKINLPSGAMFIESGKITYSFYNADQLKSIHDNRDRNNLDAHAFTATFINANQNTICDLSEKNSYFENFYHKNLSIEKAHSYKKIIQNDIYPGIDLKIYTTEYGVKYDLIIENHISPKNIKLQYKGLEKMFIKNENLILKTSVNFITEKKPYAYQIINGEKIDVRCEYRLKNNIISFEFPDGYEESEKLIIDPSIIFSTYSGSIADNFGYTATYDDDGFLYSAGTVFGIGYPTTTGAFQINYANNNGGTDIGITKYDTTGTFRIYSTYLGGSMSELPHSMIVNKYNELFIFGTTGSSDYPTTNNAYDQTFNGGPSFSPSGLGVSFPNGSDLIISKISANGGSLISSTFIGGSDNDGLNTSSYLKRNYADEVRGEIDIDKNNNIYIASCTYSADFPIQNSLQQNYNGGLEGCVIKMDDQLSSIIWSTYLGGTSDDAIYSLCIDKKNNVFLTGGTNSNDFPVSQQAYQNSYLDSLKADAFITHISSDGSFIINSSYFGSAKYDQAYFVELNANEDVHILGQTNALGNTLIYNSSYFELGGNQFIAVLSNNLQSLIRSTVVGTGKGSPDISPTAFLVDVCNNIYISGWGGVTGGGSLSTINMPITQNAHQSVTDGNDFYIMIINKNLDSLVYATYFGGSQSAEHVDGGTSRFDKKGVIYQSVCAGCVFQGSNHSDFPTTPGAVSNTNNSNNCNNAVFKFDFDFPILIANFNCPEVSCNDSITFNNLTSISNMTNYIWDFGDGTISYQEQPAHQFFTNGIHNISLIANSNSSCNLSDTIIKQIYIMSNSSSIIDTIEACKGAPVQIGIFPINDSNMIYSWVPQVGLSNPLIPNPISTADSSIQYQLIIKNSICYDTIFQLVNRDNINVDAGLDTSFCNEPILLTSNTSGEIQSIIWSSYNNFMDTLSSNNSYLANNFGTFYVYASNNYCYDIDSVKITNENINIQISGIENVCSGDSVFIKIDNLSSLYPITHYQWESIYNMIFSEDSSSIISYPNASSWYKTTVTNSIGCFVSDSIYVNFYERPIIDSLWSNKSEVFLGESASLHVLTNSNIIWENFETTPTISIYPNETAFYNIKVYNNACNIKDSIRITVKNAICNENRITIPNAFSPNNDNKNDVYRIIDNDGIINKFKLRIFNRFGQEVFYSNNIENNWDGKFQGKELSPQIFDYYIEIECVGDNYFFKKGNISLIK